MPDSLRHKTWPEGQVGSYTKSNLVARTVWEYRFVLSPEGFSTLVPAVQACIPACGNVATSRECQT